MRKSQFQPRSFLVPHLKVDKQGDIHGNGHPKRDAVEWMIPILWPIKVLTLPARGPYPAFKGETRISLRVMEDIEMPSSMAPNNVPMPLGATPSRYNSGGYSGSLQPAPAGSQAVTLQPAMYRRSEPVLPSQPTELTIIALKGGSAFLAQKYWVENGQMRCISNAGEEKLFPLEKLDLDQTVRMNQERNVGFIVQSRDRVGDE